MSGYGIKEARINQTRRPEVDHCGGCGTEVKSGDLLCIDCRVTPPIEPEGRF